MLWHDISLSYQPNTLTVADMDFTELYNQYKDDKVNGGQNAAIPSAGGPPPPPPGPPGPPGPPRPPPTPMPPAPPPPGPITGPPGPPPPPAPLPLLGPQQPIPQPKKSLTQLHWRPILKPPPGKKIWDDLPTIQFDNDELVTLFEKKEKKKKEGVKAPKFLNVLEMKV